MFVTHNRNWVAVDVIESGNPCMIIGHIGVSIRLFSHPIRRMSGSLAGSFTSTVAAIAVLLAAIPAVRVLPYDTYERFHNQHFVSVSWLAIIQKFAWHLPITSRVIAYEAKLRSSCMV